MMRQCDTPKACAAWMYSSSRSFSASPRSSRHSPVQLVTPRMMHRNSSRRSARCADGREQVRMAVDVDLHHQHRGGDQQHAGNRVQRGVEILDHVVDPAAEVARHDAEQQRERQHHQRRQRADHEAGADALQRQVEHVLPDLVGAEHVIAGAQERRPVHERRSSTHASVSSIARQGTSVSPRQIALPGLHRDARRCALDDQPRTSSVASTSHDDHAGGTRRRARAARYRRPSRAPGPSRCAPPNLSRG